MEKMRKQKKPAGIIFCCMLFWAVSWNALAVCADGTPEPEAVVESLTVEEAEGAAESENLSEIPNAYADILAVDSVVQEPIQTSGVDSSAEDLSKESIVLSEEPVAAEEPTNSEESVSLEDPAAAEEPVDSEESVLMEEPVAAEELVVTEEPDVDELVQLETDNGIVPAADSFESEGFVFEVSNGVAVLAGYTGSASSVTLPTSVIYGGTTYRISSVKEFAFSGCSSIKTLVIPDGITLLGKGAFKNCTSLSSITINGNIGDCHYDSADGRYYGNNSVFYNAGVNTDGLSVTFGSTVSRIPAYLFATGGAQNANDYVHMTSLDIGSGVKTIGAYAFYRCYDLNSVTLGGGLTDISSYAFANDTSLKTVRLPDSLLNIQDHAFYNCTALTDLTFGSKTASIGELCFGGCTALGTVTLPQSLTSLAKCAFKNCTGLSSITINGNIGDCHYDSADGRYYGNNSVFYNAGVNTDGLSVTFGSTVSRIPAYLFATGGAQNANDYVHMTSLNIGSKVSSIGACAFYHCYDLTSVTLPAKVSAVGEYAFDNGAMKSVIAKGENCTFGEKAFTGDGLTITGYMGYSAHQYAKENGYAFEAIKLSTPKIKNVGNTADGVWISWDKVEHAALYRIYAKTGKGSWKTIQDTDATSYTWTEATKGKKYTFRIQCINSEKDIYTSDISAVSESVKYKPVVLKAPKIKKVKNEPEGMKITWKKVAGAAKYRVYYKTGSGDWKKLQDTTSTSYIWTGAKPGEKYSFTVRMYDISGKAGPYNKTGVSKTYSV